MTHRQLGSFRSRHPFGSATQEQRPNRDQGDIESNEAESHVLQDQGTTSSLVSESSWGTKTYSRQAASVASKSDLNISLISRS
jgi:hypothetical protein